MTPEHNPPKDPSLAETAILLRAPEGFRRLDIGEIIESVDIALAKSYSLSEFESRSVPTRCAGSSVREWDGNFYYRPIAPAPQAPQVSNSEITTEPKAPVLGDATAPADKSLKAFIELEMETRRERDEARAQVSILKDAVTQAREALDRARMHFASVKSHLGKEVSDDGPRDFAWTEACYGWDECERALVSITQPDGGKV